MTHLTQRLVRRIDPLFPSGSAVRVPSRRQRTERERADYAAQHGLGWKRIADIGLSVVAIVVVSPLTVLAAIAVKTTSRGPVFFRQERIGLERRLVTQRETDSRSGQNDRRGRDRRVLINCGRPFPIYKFRTMILDAENGTPRWASERDPRITSVGRFLRRTRIDELPQFWNVLLGHMSIVGPRPERAHFIGRIEKELPEFRLRLRTKPGITGLAQVELGYTNTDEGLRQKLQFDLEYIGGLHPLNDLRILFKTVFVVLTGKGAC